MTVLVICMVTDKSVSDCSACNKYQDIKHQVLLLTTFGVFICEIPITLSVLHGIRTYWKIRINVTDSFHDQSRPQGSVLGLFCLYLHYASHDWQVQGLSRHWWRPLINVMTCCNEDYKEKLIDNGHKSFVRKTGTISQFGIYSPASRQGSPLSKYSGAMTFDKYSNRLGKGNLDTNTTDWKIKQNRNNQIVRHFNQKF